MSVWCEATVSGVESALRGCVAAMRLPLARTGRLGTETRPVTPPG